MIPHAFFGAADVIKQPERVQSTSNASSGAAADTTCVLAYTSAVQGGSLLVASFTFDVAGTQITGVTDTQGNLWRLALAVTQTTQGQRNEIWYCEGCRGGPNTVTGTLQNTAAFRSTSLLEASSVAKTNALDKTASAIGTSASPNSGSVFPTTGYQYLVGNLQGNSGTASAGWTKREGTDIENQLFDQTLPTAASVAFNPTMSSGNWAALIATFRAAGQGAV